MKKRRSKTKSEAGIPSVEAIRGRIDDDVVSQTRLRARRFTGSVLTRCSL